jgi:stearoyl-CoA desaturase (delta-9 desaturase)
LAFLFALHASSAVNYFGHRGGYAPYPTGDDSRNQPLLAILFLGEGWHNNHHYYPGSARAGFLWYELDPLYLMLRVLSLTGLVWDLREVPRSVIAMRMANARLVTKCESQ